MGRGRGGSFQTKRRYRTGGLSDREVKFNDKIYSRNFDSENWINIYESGTSNTTPINGVAVGDGENERDGRRIGVVSIHLRGTVYYPAIETNASIISSGDLIAMKDVKVRLCVVLDKQANGTSLNPSEVMEITSPTTDNRNFNSFRNLEWSKRFIILYDRIISVRRFWQYAVDETSATTYYYAAAEASKNFKWNYRFKTPLICDMTGTSDGAANINTNSIMMMAILEHPPSSTVAKHPAIFINSRCRFVG